MQLGPFISKITRYAELDISDVYNIPLFDTKRSEQDRTDVELLRFMLDDEIDDSKDIKTGDRSLSGGNLEVEWSLNIETNEGGITGFDPSVNRVWGTLVLEDLPPDSDLNDPDIDLIDYEVPFDSDSNKFKIIVDSGSLNEYKRTLEKGIKVTGLEFEWAKKTVRVSFHDYDY